MTYSLLKRLRMKSVCVEEKAMDRHTQEGLRILARIIARDFMAKQTLSGDSKNGDANDEHIQDK